MHQEHESYCNPQWEHPPSGESIAGRGRQYANHMKRNNVLLSDALRPAAS
jgi:hypothetical protein